FSHLIHQYVQRALGLIRGHAWLKSSADEEPAVAAIVQIIVSGFNLVFHHERNPDVGRKDDLSADESFRCYADNIEWMTVEKNRFTYNRRIGTKPRLPAAVADYRYGIGVWNLVFCLSKHSSDERFHAQQIKIIAGDDVAPYSFVVSVAAQTNRSKSVCVYPSQDIISVPDVFVFRIGESRKLIPML